MLFCKIRFGIAREDDAGGEVGARNRQAIRANNSAEESVKVKQQVRSIKNDDQKLTELNRVCVESAWNPPGIRWNPLLLLWNPLLFRFL